MATLAVGKQKGGSNPTRRATVLHSALQSDEPPALRNSAPDLGARASSRGVPSQDKRAWGTPLSSFFECTGCVNRPRRSTDGGSESALSRPAAASLCRELQCT